MAQKLHLTAAEHFPQNLARVGDVQLQVLDSQIQRQLDLEVIADGEMNPETEFRRDELNEEFKSRDKRKPFQLP